MAVLILEAHHIEGGQGQQRDTHLAKRETVQLPAPPPPAPRATWPCGRASETVSRVSVEGQSHRQSAWHRPKFQTPRGKPVWAPGATPTTCWWQEPSPAQVPGASRGPACQQLPRPAVSPSLQPSRPGSRRWSQVQFTPRQLGFRTALPQVRPGQF